jgi:hypothetical protein
MSTESDYYATQPVLPEEQQASPTDPLAKITMLPRTFAVVLAGAALLLGLVLALVPVHVAGPDPTKPTSVSCGNTIGGVESDLVGEGLPDGIDETAFATYVGTCESAIEVRRAYTWPLFFAGAIAFAWFGTVRREPREG